MITVRLPATLQVNATGTLEVREPVATLADLIQVIDRRLPGFEAQLNDSVFNFAVNDEMVLFRARDRTLCDGDVVEIVPTISGGALQDDGDDHRNQENGDERFGVAREIEFNHGIGVLSFG